MTSIFKYFQTDKIKYRYEKIKDIIKSDIYRPDCQRYIDNSRISEMLEDFNNNFEPVTPLYFCIYNHQRWIIDGQHRLEVYRNFKKYLNEKIPIVDIYVKEQKEIYKYFLLINNQMGLNEVWRQKEDLKTIILETYNYFIKKYPYTFTLKNPRCRPYIGPDQFLSQITNLIKDDEFINNYDIKTSNDLIFILENLNTQYSEQNVEFFHIKGKKITTKNILEKIKKRKDALYFGMLQKTWMDNVICFTIPEPIKMTSSLRQACWTKWMGDNTFKSKCWCCNINDITAFNFEAGHIKARILGGSNTIENLRPICGFCNKGMGKQNMFKFMEKNGYNHHENEIT